ncbi:decarboxylating 6-phosphogluconate dehydrogenase [soil metagenome]
MRIGIIGLGRMGSNIARRLIRDGHECVVHDRAADAVSAVVQDGALAATGISDMLAKLEAPRTVWLMLPAGAITEQILIEVAAQMNAGDILIDGGNSFYKDDIRHARLLKERGIVFIDVGTSGGVWGLERGYCLMIGGETDAVKYLDPIFATLAPGSGDIPQTPARETRDPRVEQGYMHCGPAGSGHFVKMIHNGIEYGLMQAYGEGFDILRNKASESLPVEERYDLNIADIAELWRRGSVVSSWLLDLCSIALAKDEKLTSYTGSVADSGEGRWTVEAAIEEAVPADVLSTALYTRFRSRRDHTFAEKILSAMRFEFGGHVEKK